MSVVSGPNIPTSGLVLELDANNPKSWSTNTHPNPLDAGTWATPGGANQGTVSRDTTVTDSPAGGVPLKFVTTGASAYIGTYNSTTWHITPAVIGQTWTVSFWVKGSGSFQGSMLIFEAAAAGTYLTYGQPYYNITTGWTRVSGTYTTTNASCAYLQVRFDCYNTGVTVWYDGIQVEKAAAASTFNPMTNVNSLTWTDLSGTVNGVVQGVPAPITTDVTTCFNFAANTGLNHSSAISGFGWTPQPIPNTGSFTFNCWVKSVPTSVGQQALFSNTADANGFRFGIGTDGVYYLIGPTYTEGALSFSGTFVNTQWNNVCVVFDRAGTFNSGVAQMRGYLNGSLFNSATLPASQTAWTVSGYQSAFMAKGLATFVSYSGKLSKFEIYSRALSVTEIVQNYNALKIRHGLI